jgi:cell division septation protein DedD
MKKKTVFLFAFVAFTILAIYAIWHYSPLRHLTKSRSQPGKKQTAALGSKNQPLIVKKKIFPRPVTEAQEKDIPQPLIVLKDLVPTPSSESDVQNKTTADSAVKKNKVLVLQPNGKLLSPPKGSGSAQPDEASKKIVRKTESMALEKKSDQPYSILLASCRLPQSARKVISDYQKVGFAPYVTKVEFKNGEVWLRVFTGQYPTRKAALKVKKEHRLSSALIKKTPYANLIGTFSSQNEMKERLKGLKDLGYFPYVLEGAADKFQLMVGAFITREGAEKQKSELLSKGISNEIVKR